MRIAICPGSFDPVTKGHLNIIERSAKLFDAVTVLVMVNPNKTPSFTAQERADFLRRVTGHIPNVKVDVYTGLLAEYAHNVGACTIIKGLRAVTDFEFPAGAHQQKAQPGAGDHVRHHRSGIYVPFVQHGASGGQLWRRRHRFPAGRHL